MRLMSIPKAEERNFILFFSGRSISVLMSSVYTFAAGLYVLKMTGSGLSFAVTLCLQIIPTVLIGPFAGVLADQFDKKLMVIITDAFNGVLFIGVFFISKNGLTLFHIYAATLLLSVSQSLYNVCIDSAVPNIVSERRILTLNSIGKIVDSAAAIVSPGLGGILYASLGIRSFILLNGIAFLLSTGTECLINFRFCYNPAPKSPKFDPKRDLLEGIHYIRKTDWIKNALKNFLIVNFFIALCYSVPVPYILNNTFHMSSGTYGTVQCFAPAGMMLGALLIKKITGAVSYAKLTVITELSLCLCLFLFGALPAFDVRCAVSLVIPYYALLLTFSGLIVSLVDIPFINNFQTLVPESIRGRSLSISISAVKIFTPLGYVLSGIVMTVIPAFYLPLCGGGFLLVFCLVANRTVKIRKL